MLVTLLGRLDLSIWCLRLRRPLVLSWRTFEKASQEVLKRSIANAGCILGGPPANDLSHFTGGSPVRPSDGSSDLGLLCSLALAAVSAPKLKDAKTALPIKRWEFYDCRLSEEP